ncbi:hypothetical protein [Niallia sp. 03133]|uniref:hypothetical protein n=1 Tax=Niallia sp. 03133 TaxID=3458060 RepID=UPI004043EECA
METFLKKFTLQEKLTMDDILSFYETSKEFNGKCQLLCKKHVIETTNLPNLVSFFLTANKKQAVHLKLEGQQVKKFWKEFTSKNQLLFEKWIL